MILNFLCNTCQKAFTPEGESVEYSKRGDQLLFKCPSCVRSELKNWTLKNVQFGNKNFQSTVSMELQDGTPFINKPYTESAGMIVLDGQQEYPRQHVSDQLRPLLDKYREERDKWNAQIEFFEAFEGNYIAITAQALKEPLRIAYKVREDKTLWLDPNSKPIPPQIKEQIQQIFDKKYGK